MPKNNKTNATPINPDSSAITAKIKSVWASGKNFSCDCEPKPKPRPKSPPAPTAIIAWEIL